MYKFMNETFYINFLHSFESLKPDVSFTVRGHLIWVSHIPSAQRHMWLVAAILDSPRLSHIMNR